MEGLGQEANARGKNLPNCISPELSLLMLPLVKEVTLRGLMQKPAGPNSRQTIEHYDICHCSSVG